jgi:hypothetical protein
LVAAAAGDAMSKAASAKAVGPSAMRAMRAVVLRVIEAALACRFVVATGGRFVLLADAGKLRGCAFVRCTQASKAALLFLYSMPAASHGGH